VLAASVAVLATLSLAAEPSAAAARVSKSVRGTLQSVDSRLNSVIMTTDDGQRLSWRFSPAVITEAVKFSKGAPVIVIYRQISPNEKRVTAIAFPGAAATPIYVNLTGSRVLLRSSAADANGQCPLPVEGPVSESVMPVGGRAELTQGCWCCAPAGNTCTPGTRAGLGQAFLERCFE
jgi:hypothetical protein